MIIPWKFCLLICPFLHISWTKIIGNNVVIFNITTNKKYGLWINTNTYSVNPHSTIRPFDQFLSYTPGGEFLHYHVKNIGRDMVHAYARKGDMFNWISATSSADIKPGEMVHLDPTQDLDYNQLVISNYKSTTAYVQCIMGKGYDRREPTEIYWNFDIDMNNLMKKLVVFGSDFIPMVGPIISNVIDFFWPGSSVDAWEMINDKVTNLIDSSVSHLIKNILENKIRMFKKRIQTIAMEQTMGINKRSIALHYLNVAQDLIGLEEEFVFNNLWNSRTINYATLPLFSLVVSMKIMFYRCGLEDPDALGLDKDNIEELKLYAFEVLNPTTGIIQKHIQQISDIQIQHTYDHVNSENLFNDMANIKTYVAFNGEQYLVVWNDMVNGSPAKGKPHNPVLQYPSYIGTPTADLLSLGGRLPLFRTLTPNLKNGKRSRIVSVQVHTFNSYTVGIDVFYNDNTKLSSGLQEGTSVDKFTVEPHYIEKLYVWGRFPGGIITGLNFVTDGNTTYESGQTTDTVYVFEMAKHHIAGIHMSNDMELETTQAWNVAVSFQADDINHE